MSENKVRNEFCKRSDPDLCVYQHLKSIVQHSPNKFIFFGDTSHKSKGIFNFYTNKHFIDSLSSAGIKTLGLEIPLTLQPVFDMYAQQKITRFAAESTLKFALSADSSRYNTDYRAKQLLDMVSYAKDNGMRISLLDGREGSLPEGSAVYQAESVFYSSLAIELSKNGNTRKFNSAADMANTVNSTASFVFSKMPPQLVGELSKFYMAYQSTSVEERMKKRLSEDYRVADRLNKIDGRVAVIYGSNHLDRKTGDIDDVLGADNTTTIMMLAAKFTKIRSNNELQTLIADAVKDKIFDHAIAFDPEQKASWITKLPVDNVAIDVPLQKAPFETLSNNNPIPS